LLGRKGKKCFQNFRGARKRETSCKVAIWRQRMRWKDNIKMDHREIDCEDVN
jgi:hypothetical protein